MNVKGLMQIMLKFRIAKFNHKGRKGYTQRTQSHKQPDSYYFFAFLCDLLSDLCGYT
jgi:hypothetical protein